METAHQSRLSLPTAKDQTSERTFSCVPGSRSADRFIPSRSTDQQCLDDLCSPSSIAEQTRLREVIMNIACCVLVYGAPDMAAVTTGVTCRQPHLPGQHFALCWRVS